MTIIKNPCSICKLGFNHFLFFIIYMLLVIHTVSASLLLHDGTEISSSQISDSVMNSVEKTEYPLTIHFFYNPGCHSCKDVREFLAVFGKKHPDIPIEYHNLASNIMNKQLFSDYKKQFQNFKISYPVIFMGEVGLSGSSDIIHYTELISALYQKTPDIP